MRAKRDVDILFSLCKCLPSHGGRDAPALLMRAAKRLEPIDADLARATYLDALSAAMFAGLFANPGGGALEVSRAVSSVPQKTCLILIVVTIKR